MDVRHLVVHAVGTVPVGGGGGGIDETRLAGQGPLAELLGELVIVPHQVVRVTFRGGGAGSEVEDMVKMAEPGRAVLHGLQEVVAVDVVGKLERDEVFPFLVGA